MLAVSRPASPENQPMATSSFHFQRFSVRHGPGALKVTTDACFLGALAEPENARQIVDMGSGTGLLSLMVAQRARPDTVIHAVENNLEAVAYLVDNVRHSPFDSMIQPQVADVVRFAQAHAGQMDMAIANPPFFRGLRREKDPGLNAALHMAADLPLAWTEAASEMLKPAGRLYIMWPPDLMQTYLPLAERAGFGLQRLWHLAHAEGNLPIRSVALLAKGLPSKSSATPETVFVRDASTNAWSPAFHDLMRGYYLGLS